MMKKTYQITELDCAACAAKMESAIRKLDGVTGATVNFLSQKLVLEADDARFEAIFTQAVKLCKKVEPDCQILS